MTGLRPDPLDLGALVAAVADPEHGAVATFLGCTRRDGSSRPVAAIEYEAYEELTERELAAVCDEARTRFGAAVACHHRTGHVPVGEPSVMQCLLAGLVLLGASVGCSVEADGEVETSETSVGSSTSTTGSNDDASGADSTGESTSTGGSETETDGIGPPPDPLPYEPARYPGYQTHSPITPYVADRMREIALLGPDSTRTSS